MSKDTEVRQVILKPLYSLHYKMAHKCYKFKKCDYVSKQCHDMIAHVLQAHFDEKNVPFKCRVYGACKATNGALHCHNRKNHPKIHPEKLGQTLGNWVNMTEQDFILSHFVEVNQDVTEPGTSCEGASTPEKVTAHQPVKQVQLAHQSLKQMLANQNVPWIKQIQAQHDLLPQSFHLMRIH